uniref:Uncharacterized protein n=1 Tax=viral metagenome TaxID=1070528 RepID=A0A6C0CGJ1_9ZZZZ
MKDAFLREDVDIGDSSRRNQTYLQQSRLDRCRIRDGDVLEASWWVDARHLLSSKSQAVSLLSSKSQALITV